MSRSIQSYTILICFLLLVHGQTALTQDSATDKQDKVEIVTGEQRTIYEYRQNGQLVAIKVVPKKGKPYYMVPAETSAVPANLESARHLYPQWVIVEW